MRTRGKERTRGEERTREGGEARGIQKMTPLSVSELNQAIAAILTDTVGTIRVAGEISNFKRASSGHRYFTLKDEGGQVACTLWRGRPLNFLPSDGMKVTVTGDLTVYSRRGQYQIDCHQLVLLGRGELHIAFETLKRELAARGYFDRDRKQPLPTLPLEIGVVTSPTGAVLHDILSTLERRLPACRVNFASAAVQGDRAPAELARAIATLDRQGTSELVIVARGGGALEDLWAFNTPIVAEAIYNAQTPIVSGVGHETDYTIADFVADVRAATPTAAAELATPYARAELLAHLNRRQQELSDRATAMLAEQHRRLETLAGSDGLRLLGDRLSVAQQHLDEIQRRAAAAMRLRLGEKKQLLEQSLVRHRALHPLAPLKRGFALLRRHGQWIAPESSLECGDRVEIIRTGQIARATINDIDDSDIGDSDIDDRQLETL